MYLFVEVGDGYLWDIIGLVDCEVLVDVVDYPFVLVEPAHCELLLCVVIVDAVVRWCKEGWGGIVRDHYNVTYEPN